VKNMENIIKIENLSKSYGDVKAVQDISFCVKKGDFFAFLGINGAGKSTTISIMCSLLKKDSGTVLINGKNIEKDPYTVKNDIGVVFQNSVLDKALSVKDNLESRAALYGITGNAFSKRLNELSELLEFDDILSRAVGKLSGGQRRKIDIARALIHKPQILILDEPTTGLDPGTRKLLWDVITKLRKENSLTVFLTTHYMEEAADADYIVILDSGKVAASGTPLQLKNMYSGDFITIYNKTVEEIKPLGCSYEAMRESVRLSVSNTAEATALILKYPEIFTDYEITKGKMDDVFLAVTGKKLSCETAVSGGGK